MIIMALPLTHVTCRFMYQHPRGARLLKHRWEGTSISPSGCSRRFELQIVLTTVAMKPSLELCCGIRVPQTWVASLDHATPILHHCLLDLMLSEMGEEQG